MKQTICDICEKSPAESFYFPVGMQTDPGGGPSSSAGPFVDLCSGHVASFLRDFIKTQNHEFNEQLLINHNWKNPEILLTVGQFAPKQSK